MSDDRPITTLFVNHWAPPVPERQAEIDQCLRRNLDCPSIDRVVVLVQSGAGHRAALPASPKLVVLDLPAGVERPCYSDFFTVVNACTTTPWDLNIVGNSDIFFDESLELLKPLDLFQCCLALSRWEWREGRAESLAGSNSQDTWIFQGPVRPLAEGADIPIGIYGCDWRIAWILHHNDYALLNVPHDVRSYHLHDCPYRNNGSMIGGPHVAGIPYRTLADWRLPTGRHDRGGVLAYSLWGSSPRYTVGAVENARLAKWVYPDWTVRVYCDESVPAATLDALRRAAAQLLPAPNWPGWHGGLFWRLLAIDDPGFVRWAIRDADSRPGWRERRAVEAWIDSGLPLHTVCDHPGHQRPVMLCDFDGRRGALPSMATEIAEWRASGHGDAYGSDEQMILERLWPAIHDKTLVHSQFGDRFAWGGRRQPFPPGRADGYRFVGEHIYEDGHHNGDDRDQYLAARLAAGPARVSSRQDLLRIVPLPPAPVIAEIGVFRGEFAAEILAICRPAELHLVDLWSGPATSGDQHGRNVVTVADMEVVYQELLAKYAGAAGVHLHRGDSVEVLTRFPDRSLDAAYLDTSHHYDQTQAELAVLAQKIRPGGWLMGHDYYPACPAWSAVNDWCAATGRRIAYLTESDGCPSFAINL